MPGSSENEPVNLLACDGGGIRGVSELVILDELMQTVQKKANLAKIPKPCEYFHLMGGTSTGGLVAIMLGRLEMSTEEALKAYDSFASNIFSKRRRSLVEKYKAKRLEETVMRLVRDQDKGSLMRDSRPGDAKGRAFVCTMPEQRHRETVRLRTYEVAGDRYPAVLIWQAARATTAATTYFRPMPLMDEEGREEKFVDAALGTNNPISICLEEAAGLYGTQRRLGCLVSLGTGSRQVEMQPHGSRRLVENIKFLWSAVKVMKEIGTDSESDHRRMKAKFAEFENTYFRLNVDGGAQGIELSDWEKIGELKERTRVYLQSPGTRKTIEELADVLLGDTPNQGLTLAHGGGLSRETTIPAQPRFIRRGKSSNIFTGRERILKRLDEHFGQRAPGDTKRREFQLRGMGGVGKTQIALKFTERNDKRFHIMWVDATDKVTIEQSFSDIAHNILGREEEKQPVKEVLRWLQQTDDEWLLVFDNSPDSGLGRYLPDGDHGNILYTTRHRNLQPCLQPQCIATIDEMEIQDAVQLLLVSGHIQHDVEGARELAKAIVRELGRLPLAIDQAGAYIRMAPCPLDQYLKVFNEQKETLLRNPRFKGRDEARHIAVYATFNISYQAIKACADKKGDMGRVKDAELALKLLRLICFYHNEGSLYTIFGYAAVARHKRQRHIHYPLKADDVDLDEFVCTEEAQLAPDFPDGRKWRNHEWYAGIKFLNEFSLLKFDNSIGYSNMHVLVHDWARNRMDARERSEWGFAARCLLMDSLPVSRSRVEDILYRRNAVPHLEACLKYVDVTHGDLALESEYQAMIARVFCQSKHLEAAKTAQERALEYRKEAFGLLDPDTFTAMTELADIHKDLGHFVEAEEMLLEVIDRRRLLDREKQCKAAQKAGATGIESMKLDAKTFYSEDFLDNSKIRLDIARLIHVLLEQDSKKPVERLLTDLIRWEESKHGKNCEQTRRWQKPLDNIRSFNRDEQQYHREVERARQEVETAAASKGPLDPDTISAKAKLAHSLMDPEDLPIPDEIFQEAYALLLDVCEWNEYVYGRDSLEWLEATRELGELLVRQDRVYEADKVLFLVLAKNVEALGQRHIKTLNSLESLACCFAGQAEYRKAIASMSICLDGREGVLGPAHTMTRVSAKRIQLWRHCEEKMSEDEKAATRERAAEASKKALGDDTAQLMMQQPVDLQTVMFLFPSCDKPTQRLRATNAEMYEVTHPEVQPLVVVNQSPEC